MVPNFDDYYHKRAAAIRFLRKQTKPWSTSQDLDVEMEWEEERHPGFRALLEGIRTRNERQEEEGDPEPGSKLLKLYIPLTFQTLKNISF
jgi:hypothetical protein